MTWDLIVVGGGAAGYFGAIAHAEAGGGSTLILEKASATLAKVKISGGGRCNVTQNCSDPRTMVKSYPRGEKALLGGLHRFGVGDTIDWFRENGLELKTEADGRMFPTTDRSQSVIDCLVGAAERLNVETRTGSGVHEIEATSSGFELTTDEGNLLRARQVLLATGGTRLAAGARLGESLGHSLEPAVPSLFTFKIADERLEGIPGLSVAETQCAIPGTKLRSEGPLLVTHAGLSGPGILRLSAWGARVLAERAYRFPLQINWLPGVDVAVRLESMRTESAKSRIDSRSPFEAIPKRLWSKLSIAARIPGDQTWAHLTKKQQNALANQLSRSEFEVEGKSLNKDEFVTCGGVRLKEIDPRTMQSRICPGVYFAGEVMDVDGITGGYNFQNAWTSGRLAGLAAAEAARTA